MRNKSLKAEKHPQEQIPVSFTNQQLLSHDCKYAQPQSNNDSSVRSFNSDIYDDDEPLPKSTALEKANQMSTRNSRFDLVQKQKSHTPSQFSFRNR